MKYKTLDIADKNCITLLNLERSIKYGLNTGNQGIIYSAFRRANEIMLKRSKEIAKTAGIKKPTVQEILSTTNNETHKLVLKMLFELKLKPKQIVELVKNNRGERYSIRTIQKIRENALDKIR
ncbi:hypothetical protein HYU06_00740 [Candidatus Woesearchaeota archaeon]|nr:hypothetical protein [Candidatus Woesearchaeota archaeon]